MTACLTREYSPCSHAATAALKATSLTGLCKFFVALSSMRMHLFHPVSLRTRHTSRSEAVCSSCSAQHHSSHGESGGAQAVCEGLTFKPGIPRRRSCQRHRSLPALSGESLTIPIGKTGTHFTVQLLRHRQAASDSVRRSRCSRSRSRANDQRLVLPSKGCRTHYIATGLRGHRATSTNRTPQVHTQLPPAHHRRDSRTDGQEIRLQTWVKLCQAATMEN